MLDNEINIKGLKGFFKEREREGRKEGRLASRIRLILFNEVNFSLYWILKACSGRGEDFVSS